MINVLNRGLTFCILPIKIDITKNLVDWKRFELSMILTEFWYGKETKDIIFIQIEPLNESYYEIFVKYVWRRDEFRSYISRRSSIMLQNGFVCAGVSPIFKSG